MTGAHGFSIIAFIVAFILTPQLESNVVNARLITNDDPWAILSHPIGLALLALSVASMIYLGPKKGGKSSAVGTSKFGPARH